MKREEMNQIEQLSAFVVKASYDDLTAEAQRQIKVRVLDWLACAIGAAGFEPMRRLRTGISVRASHKRCLRVYKSSCVMAKS